MANNKKVAINSKNNDVKCFQYNITIALNLEQIKHHPDRILKFKLFINKYDWKTINFAAHKNDWKKSETNNNAIALNTSFSSYNSENIRHDYIPKRNSKHEIQVILLLITDYFRK